MAQAFHSTGVCMQYSTEEEKCPSLNDYHANHKLLNRHKANIMLLTKMSISNLNVILPYLEISIRFFLCVKRIFLSNTISEKTGEILLLILMNI